MAGFVQIIEYQTSRPDEVEALTEEFLKSREASGEGPGPYRVVSAVDRDRSGHYVRIVEFESYEAAMENSKRADTTNYAAGMADLCDGPPTFQNLDIMRTMESNR
jgi:quinol monooxygenase YgiN